MISQLSLSSFREFINALQKVFLFRKNKIADDCSLALHNSMKINSITGNSNEDVDEWYTIFKGTSRSMRDIEGEHRLAMGSDLRSRPNQILHVKTGYIVRTN